MAHERNAPTPAESGEAADHFPAGQLPPHNVPVPLTPLIGRIAEVQQVIGWLRDPACRLLTIIGVGGAGKSHLAQAAALRALNDPAIQQRFPDGLYFVPLACLADPNQLAGAVAAALRFDFDSPRDPTTQLLDHLRQRRLMLLFDTVELIASDPTFLVELLEVAPGLMIVATSRQRLNVTGEQLMAISGLPYPEAAEREADYPALELFVRTAQAVQPDFAPAAEWPQVIEICRQLQGLPLGIQLAASALRTYTCHQIATGLRTNLDFLTATMPNVAERHRTLRAVFDYSWALLSGPEQRLLQQLAIFADGFTATAAAETAGTTPAQLASLCDQSVLARAPGLPGLPDVEPRFQIHSIIRQYAGEKLAEHPALEQTLRKQHCAFYTRLVSTHGQALRSAEVMSALALLRREWDNIRLAWQWAATAPALAELEQSLPGIVTFYRLGGPLAELQALLTTALQQVQSQVGQPGAQQRQAQQVAALLLAALAETANEQGDYENATAHAAEATRLAQASRHVEGEAQGYLQWGRAHFFRGQYDEAQRRLSTALATALTLQADYLVAAIHFSLAANRLYRGDYTTGQHHYDESLRLYQELGDQTNIYKLRYNMALMHFYTGDYLRARAIFDECADHYRAIDDRRSLGRLLNNLGAVYTQLGDYAQARAFYDEALAVKRSIGDRPHESLILANQGLLATLQHDFDTAVTRCRRALEIGQELGERAVIAYAQTCLGHALVGIGWLAEAADLFTDALALRQALGQPDQALEPLAGLAALFLTQEQPQQAQGYVETILPHLHRLAAAGIVEPFRIYWVCYQVLTANRDLRATEVLTAAHRLLQARASLISHEPLRRLYLEQVDVHQAIVAAYAQLPDERHPEEARHWRQRIEQHANLIQDLENLLKNDDQTE
jgi:predicted ATPase